VSELPGAQLERPLEAASAPAQSVLVHHPRVGLHAVRFPQLRVERQGPGAADIAWRRPGRGSGPRCRPARVRHGHPRAPGRIGVRARSPARSARCSADSVHREPHQQYRPPGSARRPARRRSPLGGCAPARRAKLRFERGGDVEPTSVWMAEMSVSAAGRRSPPQVPARPAVDELRDDPHAVADPPHAPLEHAGHLQPRGDLRRLSSLFLNGITEVGRSP